MSREMTQLDQGVRLVADPESGQGEYQLDVDGQIATLRFHQKPGAAVDLFSTFVPPAGRGRGVAARLVGVALDDLRAKGEKIIPTCSYLGTYLERHPEDRDLVA